VISLFAVLAPACNAAALFAQLAAATGGTAWQNVAEISATGRLASAGLQGVAAFQEDLRDGRYAMRFTLPIVGTSEQIYDGTTVWSRDISGGVHPYDSWYPRARAVTDAFVTRRAYLDPRSDAKVECLGPDDNASQQHELVRVTPPGGIAATLAVDERTHLLDSVSIRTPTSTDVTTYGDYRQTGGLRLPFTIATASLFEPANGTLVEVTRYAVAAQADDADFRKPQAAGKARMNGVARSTSVPITLEARQLLVWASIDGHSPMPFILDSGGHAILDSVAAKMLGIRGVGSGVSGGAGAGTIGLQYARVGSVQIGNAELLDQPFLIIPYPYSFYERGSRVPLAGILGLEWFERYAIRIDYAARRLTLTPLATFVHSGGGAAVPIRFQEDMPLATAAADGNAGDFGVDTGNAGLLVLYGDFLRRTGLMAKYGGGTTIRGEGTGGGNTGSLQKLARFEIGGAEMLDIDADLTQMKTGSFSSWTEAGDLGLTVLSRFTPTFDYARQTLYLDPAPHPLVIARNRSGIGFAKKTLDAIEVVSVRPGSPAAAAGIASGDRIVAVNGRNVAGISAADFYDLVTAPARAPLQLTIQRDAVNRTILLTLR